MLVPLPSTGDAISPNPAAGLTPEQIRAALQEQGANVVKNDPRLAKLSDNEALTTETSSSDRQGIPASQSALGERDIHGKRVIEGFLEITRLVIYISGLGASFIFSSILSQLQPPSNWFDIDKVRFLLAVSWLMFLAALGLACFLTLLLIFNAVEVAERWRKDKKWPIGTFIVCITILCCLIGAYACVGLALIAYQFWVGIIGFCLGGLVFLVAILLGVVQLYRELTFKYYIATGTY